MQIKKEVKKNCNSQGKQKEQEAHGPHRSPEKLVQINKHKDYIITLIRRGENQSSPILKLNGPYL